MEVCSFSMKWPPFIPPLGSVNCNTRLASNLRDLTHTEIHTYCWGIHTGSLPVAKMYLNSINVKKNLRNFRKILKISDLLKKGK